MALNIFVYDDVDGEQIPRKIASFSNHNRALDLPWPILERKGNDIFVEYIEPVMPEPAPEKITLSPVQFKLLFTSAERIAINESADPVVRDFMSILNDPGLKELPLDALATIEGVRHLESVALIGEGRADQILSGGR